MKLNYNYIKIVLVGAIIVFLYVFSINRNNARIISGPEISFNTGHNLFVTKKTVSKLLIQNNRNLKNISKEIIDLNVLENTLNKNPMIKSAQVFIGVKGLLTAEINQRKPIARVNTDDFYYIDEEGLYMPLSQNYTERVPLVTGFVTKKDLTTAYTIAKKVYADKFLKINVVEIHQNKNRTVDLKVRVYDFTVQLGSLENLDKKINNFKAFYKKALKNNILNRYSHINLQFDNQVICTKKSYGKQ